MIKDLYDCHLHVDNGLLDYNLEIKNANIIFNDIELYKREKEKLKDYHKSLIFDFRNNLDFVLDEIVSNQIVALKIHSRKQQITERDYSTLLNLLRKVNQNIPIIYDAFYFGSDLDFQPSLKGLIYLAKELPQTKFIVAHAGGIKILEYFFHLRELKNIGFDLSFSLQYLFDSSCKLDMIKLIKYTPSERLFFGSDFPFGNPLIQFENLNEIMDSINLNSEKTEGVFTRNWLNFVFN